MKIRETLKKQPIENQHDIVKKFCDMEMKLLSPRDKEGEEVISLTKSIIEKLTNSNLDISLIGVVCDNIRDIISLRNITPLSFEDDEWCKIWNKGDNVDVFANYRSLDIHKVGDLVFPNMHKYYCHETKVYGTDEVLRNPVYSYGLNFEVKDNRLTGRVIIDWYLNHTSGEKAIAICGEMEEIQFEANLLKAKDGSKFIYHTKEYEISDDVVLRPFYVTIDELVDTDIDTFAEMSSDEILQLITYYEQRIKPECYSRKESNTI